MDGKRAQQQFGRNHHQQLQQQQQQQQQQQHQQQQKQLHHQHLQQLQQQQQQQQQHKYLMQNDGGDIGQFEHALLAEQYILDGDSPLDGDDAITYNPASYHLIDQQQFYPHPNYEMSNGGGDHPQPHHALFMDAGRINPIFNHPNMFHPSYSINDTYSSPISDLRQQYSQLQQDKMQERLKVETEALIEQQHKFALRQQMNPPVARDPSIYASGMNLEQYRSLSASDSASTSSTMPLRIGNNSNQMGTPKKENNINSNNQVQQQQQQQQQQQPPQYGMYTNQGQYSDVQTQAGQQNRSAMNAHGFNSPHRMFEGHNQATQTMPLQSQPSMQQQQMYAMSNDMQIDLSQRNILSKSETSSNSLAFKKPIPAAVNSPTKLQKSPVTKRPNASSVTFSGWLYKQGSDGLRVWRKRWFVLSDYCLYYYKSAEEDKQLGSLMLPSYTVSICMPEAKNYRKFSFKLEHKNMKPVLLASDTLECMYKWVRILEAATRLQKFDESSPMENSAYGGAAYGNGMRDYFACMDSAGNSDSLPDSPSIGDGKQIILDGKYKQPLYVNAPPKPRRSRNELGYWTLTPNSSQQFLAEQARAASTNPFLPRSPPFEYEDICRKNDAMGLDPNGGKLFPNLSKNPLLDQFWPIRTRPGSVDLFEHDLKESRAQGPQAKFTFLRSKSNLEINNSSDNYFYSEANYAAKMRQSAHYLQSASPKKTVETSIKDQLVKLTNTAMNKTRTAPGRSRDNTLQRLADKSGLGGPDNQDSMKRLLVWKQKMLSSPLTRTYNSGPSSLPRHNSSISTIKRISKSIDHINTEHLHSEYGHRIGNSSDDDGTLDRRLTSNFLSASQNRINDINRENFDQYDTFNGDRLRETLVSDDMSNIFQNLDISAGSLLTKTHEELILLLIQLRRQNILTGRTIDMCNAEIKSLLTNLQSCTNVTILREYKDRLDRLSKQVIKLERQYEKKRPLINLLDNMVKLGALYKNRNKPVRRSQTFLEAQMQSRDQLQFMRDTQERNMLKDEMQYWNGLNPNQHDLQDKVNKLYTLEQVIQKDSNLLHDFQKNKINIKGQLEKLNGSSLNKYLQSTQFLDHNMKRECLEQELSGIHDHMATKSRKLEREISGNLRLENELLALKQKFEIGRTSKIGDIESGSSDLAREQQSCRDLHRQRQELSQAMSDFTKHSNNHPTDNLDLIAHTNYISTSPFPNKLPNWSETDLDYVDPKLPTKLDSIGRSLPSWAQSPFSQQVVNGMLSQSLLTDYQNEQLLQNRSDLSYYQAQAAGNVNDNVDFYNNINNLGLLDKQEIKTVRIVKRESEKRHRDRDKGVYGQSQLDDSYDDEPYEGEAPKKPLPPIENASKHYLNNDKNPFSEYIDRPINDTDILFGNLSLNDNLPGGLSSNDFQSESARHIISELDDRIHYHNHLHNAVTATANIQNDADQYRRSTPKKKKRHFTAPNAMLSETMDSYLERTGAHQNNDRWRACDDLDMEVALRTHINNTKT